MFGVSFQYPGAALALTPRLRGPHAHTTTTGTYNTLHTPRHNTVHHFTSSPFSSLSAVILHLGLSPWGLSCTLPGRTKGLKKVIYRGGLHYHKKRWLDCRLDGSIICSSLWKCMVCITRYNIDRCLTLLTAPRGHFLACTSAHCTLIRSLIKEINSPTYIVPWNTRT